VAPLAREWVEEVEEVTNRRFEAEDGVGSAGERPATGAQGGWPRCGTVRRGSGLGGGAGGVGTVGRPWGTALRHWTAATSARGGGARAGQRTRWTATCTAGTACRGAASLRPASAGLLLRRSDLPQGAPTATEAGARAKASGTRA
jgi:hypothetical protein